jgi:hypothetical protein
MSLDVDICFDVDVPAPAFLSMKILVYSLRATAMNAADVKTRLVTTAGTAGAAT